MSGPSSNFVDPVIEQLDASFDNGRPNVSLNAVKATGTGVSFSLLGARGRSLPQDKFAWQVTLADVANISAIQIDIEGSLDGFTWFQIDTYNVVGNTLRFIVDKPVGAIRAKLVTFTHTGTNASVLVQLL